jgi:hypothetical protein
MVANLLPPFQKNHWCPLSLLAYLATSIVSHLGAKHCHALTSCEGLARICTPSKACHCVSWVLVFSASAGIVSKCYVGSGLRDFWSGCALYFLELCWRPLLQRVQLLRSLLAPRMTGEQISMALSLLVLGIILSPLSALPSDSSAAEGEAIASIMAIVL